MLFDGGFEFNLREKNFPELNPTSPMQRSEYKTQDMPSANRDQNSSPSVVVNVTQDRKSVPQHLSQVD